MDYNYRERILGHYVLLKTNEQDISTILLGVSGPLLEFPVGTTQQNSLGVQFKRIDQNTYKLTGFEKWHNDLADLKLPKDLLETVEYIIDNKLYDSIQFRHEESNDIIEI